MNTPLNILKEREEEILEIMAEVEHERWSKWHKWARKNWLPENVDRWDIQAATPYSELSEEDKEKDRKEARSTIDALQEAGFEII